MKFCEQDISKGIKARSLKLCELIEDDEYIKKLKQSFLQVIALCKFRALKTCIQDITKSIIAMILILLLICFYFATRGTL